jgi:DNA-binding transcriptional LysR family regulator
MDRLDAMSTLLTVVKTGSFSAASRELGVPVASVSRRISDLEERLKTRILIRSSRQMALTDSGRSHVDTCQKSWKFWKTHRLAVLKVDKRAIFAAASKRLGRPLL